MIAVALQYPMESGDRSKNNSRADWTKEEPKQSLLTGRFLFHNVLVCLRSVALGWAAELFRGAIFGPCSTMKTDRTAGDNSLNEVMPFWSRFSFI